MLYKDGISALAGIMFTSEDSLTCVSGQDYGHYPQSHLNDGQKGEYSEDFAIFSRQSVQPLSGEFT